MFNNSLLVILKVLNSKRLKSFKIKLKIPYLILKGLKLGLKIGLKISVKIFLFPIKIF